MRRAFRRRRLLKRAKITPKRIKHPCESLFEKETPVKNNPIEDHLRRLFPINRDFVNSVTKSPEKQSYVLSSFVMEEIFLILADKLGRCKYTKNIKMAKIFDSYDEAEEFVKKLNDVGNPLYFVIKPL